MNLRFSVLTAFGIALIGSAGCGSKLPPPAETLNLVTGRVVFEDKRLLEDASNNAIVQFHPTSGGSTSQKIFSPVNEGLFSIMTEENGERIYGAPEGDYIVTITGSKHIPKRYGDPKTSELKVHVDEGQNELPPFEIKP